MALHHICSSKVLLQYFRFQPSGICVQIFFRKYEASTVKFFYHPFKRLLKFGKIIRKKLKALYRVCLKCAKRKCSIF